MDKPAAVVVSTAAASAASSARPTPLNTTASSAGGSSTGTDQANRQISSSAIQQSQAPPLLPPAVLRPPMRQQIDENEDDELFPCENFNIVAAGVYRSAFPKKKNFPFLKKLGLRSILTLILEEYPDQNKRFLDENGIKLFQFGVAGNKEPFVDIPEETVRAALAVLLDRRNHPILIHCNKGKHRTGCLVGCLRKIQHWNMTSIFEEYRRFSHPKSRSMDQQFIELFEISKVPTDPELLPDWPEINDDFLVLR